MADAADERKQKGVCRQEVTPRVDCLCSGCRQAGALSSGNVEQCARSVGTARYLAETRLIT